MIRRPPRSTLFPYTTLFRSGRSRARRVEEGQQKVTFNDVAGIDEAKGELTEIVDFLKNPERYQKLGGGVPRGVLRSEEPTGELQSRQNPVCPLPPEKKKNTS